MPKIGSSNKMKINVRFFLLLLVACPFLSGPTISKAADLNLICQGTLYPNAVIDPAVLVDTGKASMELSVLLDQKGQIATLNPLMKRDLVIPYFESPSEITGTIEKVETLRSDGAKRIESVHLNIKRKSGEITVFMMFKGSKNGAIRYLGTCEKANRIF